MKKIKTRLLNIQLPPKRAAFLWGPRKTGKTYGSVTISQIGPSAAALSFHRSNSGFAFLCRRLFKGGNCRGSGCA
jgi:hypothetical protein